MEHDEHARMHIELREKAKKETAGERKELLDDIINETIITESIE